jgi:hypothetical protein
MFPPGLKRLQFGFVVRRAEVLDLARPAPDEYTI